MSRDENSLDIFEATMAQVFIVKTITCFEVKKVNFTVYRGIIVLESYIFYCNIFVRQEAVFFFLNNAMLYR